MTKTRRLSSTLVAFGLVALSACGGATPYQPAAAEPAGWSDGYHETPLEHGRWRVVFIGNSLTSRETVEAYMLYRAAELTLREGYETFSTTDRWTEGRTDAHVSPPLSPAYRIWAPVWRRAESDGWSAWDPDRAPIGWDRLETTRYEASAEILMGTGDKPTPDPRALNARAVMESLKGRIVPPGAKRMPSDPS